MRGGGGRGRRRRTRFKETHSGFGALQSAQSELEAWALRRRETWSFSIELEFLDWSEFTAEEGPMPRQMPMLCSMAFRHSSMSDWSLACSVNVFSGFLHTTSNTNRLSDPSGMRTVATCRYIYTYTYR